MMASYYNDLAQVDGENYISRDDKAAAAAARIPVAKQVPMTDAQIERKLTQEAQTSRTPVDTNAVADTGEFDQAAFDANTLAASNAEAEADAAVRAAGGDPTLGGTVPAYTQYQADKAVANAAATAAVKDYSASQSAYDTLLSEFNKYGLGSLIEPLKGMIQDGASGATLTLALQNTDSYKKRFSANADRIAKGLTALTPAQYIGMEDQYQNIMRQYGLPTSYYTPDSTGKQPGFDQLLANDVSATELNDRVATAQTRVLNANPEVLQQLKAYYPDITNGDIMAYALDPKNAITALKQKVTAAEIGGAASAAGLSDTAAQAQQLAAYGVTGAQAQQNYGTIAQMAQRGHELASIYNQAPYGQDQATAEIFNIAGQTQALNQRKKLTALEQAQFAGQSGTASNAFSKDRPISPMMLGVPGAGSF
jgi:hypothetical protein